MPTLHQTGNGPVSGSASAAEVEALVAARASGGVVEVAGSVSETARVVALPEGFLRAEVSAVPVRALTGRGWQALDPRLVRDGEGRWSPAVSTVAVSVSGGGLDPVLRIGGPGQVLELVWPGLLPAPVVVGDAAVFGEVLPGVDLVVRATGDGAGFFLVVKDRQAAANPVLDGVRLGWRGDGIELRPGADGGVEAVSGDGTVVWSAASAVMWSADSVESGGLQRADGAAGSARAARGVAAGKHARVGIDTTTTNSTSNSISGGAARAGGQASGQASGGVVVSASRALLSDPATVFPVVIDPLFTEQRRSWAMVWSNGMSFRNPSGATEARVGYDGWQDYKVSRVFYEMWTGGAWNGKQILSARFRHVQVHSPNNTCNLGSFGPNVQLGFTGAIPADVSWSKQPAWLETITENGFSVGHSASCGVRREQSWDLTQFLRSRPGYQAMTFGLRSANEGDANGWRRYAHDPVDPGGFGAPLLTVDYNTVPVTPGGPWVSPRQYDNMWWTNQVRPDFRSIVSDPDGDRVRAVHVVQQVPGPNGQTYPAIELPGPVVTSGETSVSAPNWDLCNCTFDVWTKTQDVAADGVTVKSTSPDSVKTRFTMDSIKPPAPVVSVSPQVVGLGDPAVIGLAPGAAGGDGIAFGWSVGSNTLANRIPVARGSATSTAYTAPGAGWQQVYARVEDRAGNLSDVTSATGFLVSVPVVAHHYRLDGTGADLAGSGGLALTTTGADLSGFGHGYYVFAGEAWSGVHACTDRGLIATGTTGISTTGAAINTGQSFSVAAWVQPGTGFTTGTPTVRAAVSVPGPGGGDALVLGARKNPAGQWVYAFGLADGAGSWTWALSSVPVITGEWAHVAGVFNTATGQVRVGVNGSWAGTATFTGTPRAGTGLTVGTGTGDTGWVGVIDETRTWTTAIDQTTLTSAADWVPAPTPC